MTHDETIRNLLDLLKRRQRIQNSWRGASWGLLFGPVAALLPILAMRTVSLSVSLACIAAGFVFGAVAGLVFPVDDRDVAGKADQRYDLKDRILTATTLMKRSEPEAIERLQIEDAARHATSIDPFRVLPYRIPPLLPWGAGLAIFVTVIGLILPLAGRPKEMPFEETIPEIAAVGKTLRRDLFEKVRESARNHPDEKMLGDLSKRLERMLARFDESTGDRKESLAALSEMEDAVRSSIHALRTESINTSLRDLSETLRLADATSSIAQALKDEDYARAADGLDRFDPEAMSRRERENLAERIGQTAETMEERGLDSLASSTHRFSEELADQEGDSSKQGGAGELAGELRKQAMRRELSRELEGKLALLQMNKSDVGGGERAGASEQPDVGWGTVAAGNPTSGPETDLPEAERERQELSGILGEQGESEIERTGTPGEQKEVRARSVPETFREYRKMAETVLETESIPLGRRQMIRRYFESIRPD